MRNTVILLSFLVACLVYMYFTKASGADQEKKRLKEKYTFQLDSLTKVYQDSLHKRELFALKVFSDAIRAKDRAEGEASYWHNKFNYEKNNNRSFSDVAADSLLAKVR